MSGNQPSGARSAELRVVTTGQRRLPGLSGHAVVVGWNGGPP